MKCGEQGERPDEEADTDVETICDEEGSIVVVCHNLYCEECGECSKQEGKE